MKKIYLIHGSLGSGKTTLLNTLFKLPFFKKTALIENEFASFSVDDYLVESNNTSISSETISGGCICCTSGKEFLDVLSKISKLKSIEKIIIESTGVANSIEIIKQIILCDGYETKFEFGANIMLIDLLEDNIKSILESKRREIYFSDLVLLTKSDLVDNKKLSEIKLNIESINKETFLSLKGSFEYSNIFIEKYKSMLPYKLKNNTDDLFSYNQISDSNNAYYVIKLKSNYSNLQIKSFVNNIVSNKDMNVKRIKGFFTNLENKNYIINGTKNNIQYSKVNKEIKNKIIVVIGEKIDSNKIEKILKDTLI